MMVQVAAAAVAAVALSMLLLAQQAQANTIRLEVFSKYVIRTCDSEHSNDWAEHILASRCGKPRDMLVELPPHQSHLQITPSAVFVKQCVGVCSATHKRCVPKRQREKMISVRYHDVSTGKEWCAHYPVTEHVTCGCARL